MPRSRVLPKWPRDQLLDKDGKILWPSAAPTILSLRASVGLSKMPFARSSARRKLRAVPRSGKWSTPRTS